MTRPPSTMGALACRRSRKAVCSSWMKREGLRSDRRTSRRERALVIAARICPSSWTWLFMRAAFAASGNGLAWKSAASREKAASRCSRASRAAAALRARK